MKNEVFFTNIQEKRGYRFLEDLNLKNGTKYFSVFKFEC